MTTDINTLNESVLELLERYGDCILNDSKDKQDEESLQEVASHILHFSKVAELHKAREGVFEEFAEMIDSSSEKLDEKSTINDFLDQINSIENPFSNPNKCDRYLKFVEKISSSSSKLDEDDDIKTVSQTLNLIDPITKLAIVEPVKNKICGHVYEKNTILQFIKKNNKTKCPIAGCSAVDYVKKSDLIIDNSLKRLLKNN